MEHFDDTNTFLSEEKLPKGTSFTVPEGYFDSLTDAIASRIAINDLQEKSNPFDVPETHFKHLSWHIENKIANLEYENGTSDAFFETQKGTILNTIAIREKAGADLPFDVPAGYFEELSAAIETKTSTSPLAKTKTFIAVKWAYAAAAAILLSFGIYYYAPGPVAPVAAETHFNTDSLSTGDILLALKKSDIPEEELLKNIDAKEINDQLKIEENDIKNITDELDESDLTQDM